MIMAWDDYFAGDLEANISRRKRTITVGWTVRAPNGSVLWAPPQPFVRNDPKPGSAKSVQVCPAAVDFDHRHFVVPCPVDIKLQFERKADGKLSLNDADGDDSSVRLEGLRKIMALHQQNEWRHPERPIIQMFAPYVFVADDPCYIVQSAPYLHYNPTPRPGIQIGGRFPVHIWPRPLSWGFEWHDITKPLIMKRGEPWFYVHFETENPSAGVRLVEQEMTPELEKYVDSIVDVSNFVNKTFSLFSEAQRMRPHKLVRARK